MKAPSAADDPVDTVSIGLDTDAFWRAVTVRIAAHLQRQAVDVREAVVLLPFVQHLSLARTAWAARNGAGWMPRFETTQTLARSAGPAALPQAGALSLDATADALQADRLLTAHLPASWRRDRGQYERVVMCVVETAHALARARLAVAPAARAAWTEAARAALATPPAGAPGGIERALARLALEWAETAPTAAADALYRMRPAAWVALRAGAAEPITEAVLAQATVPTLWIDADLSIDAVAGCHAAPAIAACADFEDEAQRAAAQVLLHVARGETPVALIALDRVLLRRVRALLERAALPLSDETGWRLSTTRAGAAVSGLLRAARSGAATDDVLDWLRSTPVRPPGLDALETGWRRHRVTAVQQVDPAALSPAALVLWDHWRAIAHPLADLEAARTASLGRWLAALREALVRARVWDTLAADAAGSQVFDALHATSPPPAGSAWAQHFQATPFDASGFSAWVERVLEAEAFRPAVESQQDPLVVITPLARAMLRPFAAIVCPGADAGRLGALPAPQALLGDALARSLGLPGAAQRLDDERRAFLQLLRAPRLTLLWRRADGPEPLQPSPWLLELEWAAECSGRPCNAVPDPRAQRDIVVPDLRRPLPTAPLLLPAQLSATVYEALRACPYRFFALHALRLAEAEELDDTLDKRDYGTWLHGVLQAFHTRRDVARPESDEPLLRAISQSQQALQARDDADFLPFAASFEPLVAQYLAWLHAEEAQGMTVEHMERGLQARPPTLPPDAPGFRGRLDRIDALRRAGPRALRIVDYKTSSVASLQARLREPFEDTQLAFYAALLAAAEREDDADGTRRIEAAYLALDSRDGVKLIAHPQVEDSAAALTDGVASDFARLRAGAAMPALGEGSACDHCSARGLCRRDHWPQAGS